MHHFPLFDCVLSSFTSDHIIKILLPAFVLPN